MKLTKKLLAGLGIRNSYVFCSEGGGQVFVMYRPSDPGRGGTGATWQAIGNGFETDPAASWYDHGRKTWNVWSRDYRAAQLATAIAWTREQYGIEEMVRDPFGRWQDKRVYDRIMARPKK